MDANLQAQVNKRLTLNWLIQGASEHAGLTMHYLVRDELQALDARLLRLYDQFSLICILQYWHLESILVWGWPGIFWWLAPRWRWHPFHHHPLLSQYGGMLTAATHRRLLERRREKGVARLPGAFLSQVLWTYHRTRILEWPHRPELELLARNATSMVFGVPVEKLWANLTSRQNVSFGNISLPHSIRGFIWLTGVIGYGGVVRREEQLMVRANATNWPVLVRELVKGTAELICLHGLNELDDETYRHVVRKTDRVEYELWMMQSGSELWRRLLAALPENLPPARALMRMARLPPQSLQTLVEAVIQDSPFATELLQSLEDLP